MNQTFFDHSVRINDQYARPGERGFVRFSTATTDRVPLPEAGDWCAQNCRGSYFNDGMRFYFELARDASLFKVRYG